MLGVISSSFLSFSSMELFLLKILQAENSSLAQRYSVLSLFHIDYTNYWTLHSFLLHSLRLLSFKQLFSNSIFNTPIEAAFLTNLDSPVNTTGTQLNVSGCYNNESLLFFPLFSLPHSLFSPFLLLLFLQYNYSTLPFSLFLVLLLSSLLSVDAILTGKRVVFLSESFTFEQVHFHSSPLHLVAEPYSSYWVTCGWSCPKYFPTSLFSCWFRILVLFTFPTLWLVYHGN